MNMLLQPAPLPEEMDQGYLGRIMRINGYRTVPATWQAVEEHLDAGAGAIKHELLSQMAGQTSEQFAQNHTSIPLTRAIAVTSPKLPHGSMQRKGLLNKRTLCRGLQRVALCEDCVNEDLAFHGVSYWRRDHQMPWQLWCPKHATALYYLEPRDSLFSSPERVLGRCRSHCADVVSEAQANPFVQRLLDIASAMYERPTPLDAQIAVRVLRDRGHKRGIPKGQDWSADHIMSKRIRAIFPDRWLCTVFGDEAVFNLGSIMHGHCVTDVSSFLLATAVLFETPDEAINTLSAPARRDSRHKFRRPNEVRRISQAQYES